MWMSDDGQEVVVIKSIAELEERTGVKPIADLHRETLEEVGRSGVCSARRLVAVHVPLWF